MLSDYLRNPHSIVSPGKPGVYLGIKFCSFKLKIYNDLMAQKNRKFIFGSLFFLMASPLFCAAEITGGCGASVSNAGGSVACKAWQEGSQGSVAEATVQTCICSPECLIMPTSYYYYDDPVAKTKQADTNNITLPVVLAWDNVEAWKKEDGDVVWEGSGLSGQLAVTSKVFGAKSYLLEIDNTNNELNDSGSAKGIFRKILQTNEFNPTNEFYPCFFNSDTVIKWRVRPCCKDDGSYCMPEDKAIWWKFRTSPAPEPVWPKDPDWNGKTDAKNISFSDIKLKWCHAKISTEKLPLNSNIGAALSYEMRVYSNENKIALAGQQIPAQFADLAKWLQKDTPALPSPLSCHYLEKQQNNTCKPEVVNPIQTKTPRNSDTYYYWSHKEIPNADRALFTEKLSYSWQLRRCFNNPNAGEESCGANSEKGWGQTWQFTTKNETVPAPTLLAPPNDSSYSNSQTSKLTELPGRIVWSIPNGANSFAYDIQEISGANSQSLVGGERRTTKSQILFAKNNSLGEGEAQNIELKLDTPYKWRVKSCWPSIPVGDVCDNPWSSWSYFRTTGRAPKDDSTKPQNAANNISLPVTLQWEAVPGAKSYIVTFNGEKITTTTNQYTLDYPKIDQNSVYSWKLQTCAYADATQCGAENAETSFMTAALGASPNPTFPKETIDNSKLIYNFSWEPATGAHYYKFTLNYAEISDKETNGECIVGKKVETIAKDSSITVNNSIGQLYCLGKYDWNVLACLDQACTNTGSAPATWQFEFISAGKEIKQGETVLAVCGLTNDNPNTPWDDRERCGIKHTLLTVEQIINFILFQVSMILLPLLMLATGVMYYTQFGGMELMDKVKSWWKIIGVGYALLFFAWTITGIILSLSGYSGAWWSI